MKNIARLLTHNSLNWATMFRYEIKPGAILLLPACMLNKKTFAACRNTFTCREVFLAVYNNMINAPCRYKALEMLNSYRLAGIQKIHYPSKCDFGRVNLYYPSELTYVVGIRKKFFNNKNEINIVNTFISEIEKQYDIPPTQFYNITKVMKYDKKNLHPDKQDQNAVEPGLCFNLVGIKANEFWMKTAYLVSLHLLLIRLSVAVKIFANIHKYVGEPPETLESTKFFIEKNMESFSTFSADGERICKYLNGWHYAIQKALKKFGGKKGKLEPKKLLKRWDAINYHSSRGIDYYCKRTKQFYC